MSTLLKILAHAVVPKGVRRWLRHRFGWRWMRGDHASWHDAQRAAETLGGAAPVERVIDAARAVRRGRGAWDRDGVVFERPSVHEPLFDSLRRIAAAERGRLVLVDFGGGLGSTWWQHRDALSAAGFTEWRVVELPALAAAGRREFAGGGLSFYELLDEAFEDGRPAAVLFSSVLQYLPLPYEVLGDVLKRRVPHVILDRVGYVRGNRDKLVVQHTPPTLGGGASPCWLFSRTALFNPFAGGYRLVAEWSDDFDQVDGSADYRGAWFQLRGPTSAGRKEPV